MNGISSRTSEGILHNDNNDNNNNTRTNKYITKPMQFHFPLLAEVQSFKELTHSRIDTFCKFILDALHVLQREQTKALHDQLDAECTKQTYQTAYENLLLERTRFEEEKKAITDKNIQSNECVSLNVGGEVFTTTVSTLRRHNNSMLDAMFSGRHHLESGMYPFYLSI
jgi:hypothetical protein